MKVLVGIDDPQSSHATVQTVIDQFDPTSTEVRVLHVVAPLIFSAQPEIAAGWAPELRDQFSEGRESVKPKSGEYPRQCRVQSGHVSQARRYPRDNHRLGG